LNKSCKTENDLASHARVRLNDKFVFSHSDDYRNFQQSQTEGKRKTFSVFLMARLTPFLRLFSQLAMTVSTNCFFRTGWNWNNKQLAL
jgi:hypothetical protein